MNLAPGQRGELRTPFRNLHDFYPRRKHRGNF